MNRRIVKPSQTRVLALINIVGHGMIGSKFEDDTNDMDSAKTAAVSAIADDEAMLLLDVNRDNNAIVRDAPTLKLGVRLALHWLAWLQNAMLSYTAVL